MLNIIFGRENCPNERFRLSTTSFFLKYKKPSWFEDPFVKEFLYEIDGSTVLFEEALKNRWGHGISTEKISSGCKALCLLYFQSEPDMYYNGSSMGDNCVPFLMRIADKHDVYIFLEYCMDIPEEYLKQGKVRVDGEIVYTEYDFEVAYVEYCRKQREMLEKEEEAEEDG